MERISKKPTPDCPLCGWSRKDHPMATHEWATKTGECAGEDREPCLLRQLAAANEKLADSARLATESAQLADGMANDLAAANERANRYHRDAQKMSASLTAKMETTTGHSFGRTLANVGYHAERLRRIDTEAALREANERAGRLEAKLRSLCERLDEWWYEADPMGDVKKGERHPWTVAAHEALEVPDAP